LGHVVFLIEGAFMQKYTGPLSLRLPVFAAIATIVVVLAIGTYMRGSVADAWHLFRIPTLAPLFADTRGITHSIDCLLAGQDPYKVGSFDPWNRPFNYPPIWLQLRHLGVTSRSSNLIGTMMAIITAGACLLLFRAKTWWSALIIFFALTSRTILFTLERGNVDQLIFSLMVFGFFLIDRQRVELRSLFSGLLIGLLTILKVYPVVAAVIFIHRKNGMMKVILTATLSIAALVLTSGSRLPAVFANTPRGTTFSFGSIPFFIAIGNHTLHASTPFILSHRGAAPIGAIILASLSVMAAFLFSDRLDQFLPRLDFDHARGRLAISGLAIFCFAFIFGSSYDYRIMFLLTVVAWLTEDLNNNVSLRSLPAAILILLLMWAPLEFPLYHEVPDGLVFVLASAWLGKSLFRRAVETERAPLQNQEAFKSI
jgi:Glycosyltransferase family 87